ncbi:MAG: 3-phosphoglycerate dehydrogenase [Clostridia bacterium]|nr:3-phosphoglycerate dehydrogenase [Clostridia bacterium]MBR6783351.1 3-phosphoglycerate dehydrogenase [Clostridia bacterium]
MANIKLYNKISKVGLDVFDNEKYTVSETVENPEGILVRSAALHDEPFGKELLAIARAGAGVNNIPIDRCSENGIVVFNTPGANANGVKELALAALLLASRDIVGGVNWALGLKGTPDVAKQVEKGKSKFVGPEIKGKTLGVIGLGAIGGMVANAASDIKMKVIGCDPYITVKNAWSISRAVRKADDYDAIYAEADYITYHIPSLPTTKGIINKENIAKMKDGVRIINLSRGDLANIPDLIEALESGKVASYVTDFPCDELLGIPHVVCIPHLGASTPESEDNCAVMAAEQLIDYIENGNIRNSVNYPEIVLPRTESNRVIVLHENIPNIITQISGALASDNVNIESLLSQAKGNNAVSIFDTNNVITEKVISDISAIKGIVRVMAR